MYVRIISVGFKKSAVFKDGGVWFASADRLAALGRADPGPPSRRSAGNVSIKLSRTSSAIAPDALKAGF